MFQLFTRYRHFTLRPRGWQTTREREFITRDGQLFLTAEHGAPLSVSS
jgi:hypothetical protein